MTGKELAQAVGLSSIYYWKDKLIEAGHTRKTDGGLIIYKDSAVEWLKNRQKNPNKTQGGDGGSARTKKQIFNALVHKGWIVKDLYYTTQRSKKIHPEKGWYYTTPTGEIRFLGKNYKSAIKNISYFTSK